MYTIYINSYINIDISILNIIWVSTAFFASFPLTPFSSEEVLVRLVIF